MPEFNITGDADKVSEAIESVKQKSKNPKARIVTDVFACAPDKRDVNVKVEEEQVDDLIDWCEELGLKCKML